MNANMEEASKCFQEKNQQIMSQCLPGPQGGGAHPEGGVLPEGMDPSTFELPEGMELPEGGIPDGNPGGAMSPQGGQQEGGPPDETGPFSSFSLDAIMFANLSIICEPGSRMSLSIVTLKRHFSLSQYYCQMLPYQLDFFMPVNILDSYFREAIVCI